VGLAQYFSKQIIFFQNTSKPHSSTDRKGGLPMPFCKKDNLAEISRKYGIPYPTLYWWVRAGKIVLPRDEELLGQLRRDETGRYYLEDGTASPPSGQK
jgi:hypothetical protein